jgi:hypothetical protein
MSELNEQKRILVFLAYTEFSENQNASVAFLQQILIISPMSKQTKAECNNPYGLVGLFHHKPGKISFIEFNPFMLYLFMDIYGSFAMPIVDFIGI